MSNLTYTQTGDYLVPDLTMEMQDDRPLDKYGMMYRQHLQQSKPIYYNTLALDGTLHQHLLETQDRVNQRMNQMIAQMKQAEGVTEQMKADSQMSWVGAMNNIRSRAEEVVLQEMIFS